MAYDWQLCDLNCVDWLALIVAADTVRGANCLSATVVRFQPALI